MNNSKSYDETQYTKWNKNNDKKEILNKLLKYFKESNINDFGYEQDKLISYEEAQILLDYITNLQEENKNLKLSLKDRLKYSDELDEKIERIDKAREHIKKEIADIEWMKEKYSDYDKIGEIEVELKSIEELNDILNGDE